MSLSAFIREHHEDITVEFAAFARTLMPTGANMSDAEQRDHAEEILTAIDRDLSTSQTADEQLLKSRGRGSAKIMAAAGKLHADARIRHGFTFRSVLAEFRALRATVLRLYSQSGASDVAGILRFNEAIDEALTESMDRFALQPRCFGINSSASSATIYAHPWVPSSQALRFWRSPRTTHNDEVAWWRGS